MTAMTRTRSRRLSVAVAVLSLPVAMGPGRCGFLIDYTETLLITEPVDRIELGVDDGSVIATMYEREAVLIKRHTFGFEKSVDFVSATTVDGELELQARCKYDGNCRYDHMLEVPLGVDLSIAMADSQISLGYFDSDLDIDFESGWFKGVRLASPNFTLSLTTGDVTVDFAAIPESVVIAVGEGDVTIELPAGAYRCVLAAPAGQLDRTGITCDDDAEPVLDVQVQTGGITITGSST